MSKVAAFFVVFSLMVMGQNGDPYQPVPYVKLKHPEWARKAVAIPGALGMWPDAFA